MDTVTSVLSSIVSLPGRLIDNAMWMSPPVLIIMFVNMILLIVIIVKLVSWAFEGFTSSANEVTMYYLPWCGACVKDIDAFRALSLKYGNVVTFKMHDLGTKPITGITSSPTYIFNHKDGVTSSRVGSFGSLMMMEDALLREYPILLPPPVATQQP